MRLILAALINASDWDDIERLLDRLHPRPEEADREQIRRYLTGETVPQSGKARVRDDALLPIARKLATLLRGGTLKRGPGSGNLDSREHAAAWAIQDMRERGIPEEVIEQEIGESYGFDKEELSRLGRIFPAAPPN